MELAIAYCSEAHDITSKIFYHLRDRDCFLNDAGLVVNQFSNKELMIQFNNSIRGKDLFIVQSFNNNPSKDLLEILFASDTAFAASAGRITLVMPVLYGARQDRKSGPRTTVTTATMAKLCKAVHADRVITTSLHSPQAGAAFYAAGVKFDNLSTASIFMSELRRISNEKSFIIVSPDAGGLPKARYYAKILGTDLAFGDKRRSYGKAEIMNIVGDVYHRNCFIIDDMIDTAGSIRSLVKELKLQGAKEIYCLATHLVLSGNAKEILEELPITRIYGSNSITHHDLSDKYTIFSLSKLLSDTIYNIHKDVSVSELFEHKE